MEQKMRVDDVFEHQVKVFEVLLKATRKWRMHNIDLHTLDAPFYNLHQPKNSPLVVTW